MPSTLLPLQLGLLQTGLEPWSALAGASVASLVLIGAHRLRRRTRSVPPLPTEPGPDPDGAAARGAADFVLDQTTAFVCRFRPDSTLLYVNRAYAELWRAPVASLVGARWLDFMAPAEAAEARARLARLCALEPEDHEECWVDTPSGRRYLHWRRRAIVGERGEVVEIVATGTDVTAQRQTIEDLAEHRQRLAVALEAGELGLWDLDVDTGRVRRSPQWHELLGLAVGSVPETVAGWSERVHPDDLERVQSVTDANMRGESRGWCVDYRIRHASGRWVWVEDRGRVVEFHADGRPRRAVGVVSDASERRRLALELEDSRAAALRESEAKGRFLANMSHEIRTPLTAVLGYAELAREECSDALGDPARATEHLDAVVRNGRHLQELLDGVLDLSKIQAGEAQLSLERVDVREVARDALAMLAGRAKQKGLELVLEFAPRLPRAVRTDALRVRQVLVNLLGNAIKFTNSGRVTVRLALALGSDRRLPTALPGELHIEVEDQGVGMDATTLTRVFQPFRQADASTSRRFGGTGLGLTISRHLARLLGGELDATSSPGEGSTFRLTLPLDLDDLDQVEHAQPAPALPARVRTTNVAGRVLLVEDGADNRRLIALVLERAGLVVETAEDGREGVAAALRARDAGAPHDLVLMDVQMPVLDGYAATRELRGHGFETPIVALTANAFAEERQHCLEAGCDDHCTKPIQRDLFIATVARWIATARERAASPS
jgi:PAS domain S-box-containing protein